jgi:hypothetical protein
MPSKQSSDSHLPPRQKTASFTIDDAPTRTADTAGKAGR